MTDQTPPVVTLSGVSTINVSYGSSYVDAGATWIDNFDGTGTLIASGSVNTYSPGNYTLSYTKTDSAGNTGNTVTRTVIVGSAPSSGGGGGNIVGGGGPSPNTGSILYTGSLVTSSSSYTTTLGKNLPVIVATPQATDIARSIYRDSIRILIEVGVFNDSPKFNPTRSITRAEFVKILTRVTGFTPTTSSKVFSDVDYTSDLSQYISYGVEQGWINRNNTNFRPNDTISLTEATKLINVVIGKATSTTVVPKSTPISRGKAADLLVKMLEIVEILMESQK